jgi:hypothetical protein
VLTGVKYLRHAIFNFPYALLNKLPLLAKIFAVDFVLSEVSLIAFNS